jgi:hypothetical protein
MYGANQFHAMRAIVRDMFEDGFQEELGAEQLLWVRYAIWNIGLC